MPPPSLPALFESVSVSPLRAPPLPPPLVQAECYSAPGVGKDLVWTLCVGSGPAYAIPWCSNPVFSPNAVITYDPPRVAGVEAVFGSSLVWGSTRGNDTVRLYGFNFGVPTDAAAQVWCAVCA